MLNLIKCGIGNIGSVKNALNAIGVEPTIVQQPSEINHDYKKIILPGVGSFDSFIDSLRKTKLYDEIKKLVSIDKFKILGICVGMQSFFERSDEGNQKGLELIKGNLIKFDNKNGFKVPHMGWNNINIKNSNNLLEDLPKNRFYFAHINDDFILCNTKHDITFPSSINYKNIYGVQFHPEKSFLQGQKVLRNFIDRC